MKRTTELSSPNVLEKSTGFSKKSTFQKSSKLGQKNVFDKSILPNWDLYLFCLLGIVITIIFHYIPLYGIQIAFKNFSSTKGIIGSPWVGLKYFKMFMTAPNFWPLIKNTLIISVYSLVAGFPIPIALALMLNSFRHKRYRKVIQTVTYIPNFISVIVMCGMIALFLSPRSGVVNIVMGFFGARPINFLNEQSLWRHIYVWSGVWQGMGFSSVVYFAALAGVSPEYHEAAVVDGASKFQRMIHIDLPSLYPIITIMFILSMGSIFSVGFDKAYALQRDTNLDVSEIISTYVYKVGLVNANFSFSTAINLFNSAVSAVLLIGSNFIIGKFSDDTMF